ncbi:hypothetical protein L218DRAFT_1027531 [Marasmius fiardii PR-910]|nr:hypothetical protein L218DRAFT_1027531 [Marasmius fiardii PR-910]
MYRMPRSGRAFDIKTSRVNVEPFLWMSIHDAYMIGSNWQRPNYSAEHQEKAICGVLEDMEHILTKCESNGQEMIWRLAKRLWNKKGMRWRPLRLGDILGCGIQGLPLKKAHWNTSENYNEHGCRRFNRILISESARLIWLIRNDHVINERDEISQNEITQRWLNMINKRLNLEKDMTNRIFEKKALSKTSVQNTWNGLIRNEAGSTKDWIAKKEEVLVGIGP